MSKADGKCGRPRQRGMSLIYATMVMVFVLMPMAVLAIDIGTVMVERSKMQGAIDAATLYGVTGLDVSSAEVRKRVRESLAQNYVAGEPLKVSDENIQFGLWNANDRTFHPSGNPAGSTALRVTININRDGNNGLTSYFGKLLGETKFMSTLHATATRGKAFPIQVHAVASPYLAGMPQDSKIPFEQYNSNKGKTWEMEDYDIDGDGEDDTYGQNLDPADWADQMADKKDADGNLPKKNYSTPEYSTAGRCAAYRVDIPVKPGQVIYFRDVDGSTGDYSSGKKYGLDGEENRSNIKQKDVNGFAGMTGPLNALTGVFLDDNQPDQTSYVPGLNFSSKASRNYDQIEPGIKQIFHVGDGLNNDNGRLQRIVVPEGATRFYLGMQDELGWWWDNFGSVETNVFVGKPVLVD